MTSLCCFLGAFLLSPAPRDGKPPVADADMKALVEFLVGDYSSQEQSKLDPSYLEVHLRIIQLWPQRPDGPWIYFEQAMATAQDKPYRQRIYQISRRNDGSLQLKAFAFPGDPLRFAGIWKLPRPLHEFPVERLIDRKGCQIILKKQGDGSFQGGTEGNGCPGELRGAAYSVTELTIGPESLKTWERGFSAEEKLVWGNAKGPYILKKSKENRKTKGK